jgi:hypothetical protein
VTPSPVPSVPASVDRGWLDGPVTGDGMITLLAAVLTAVVVMIGYSIQRHQARKAEQAIVYGEAIRAVHDYLEAPYRVRRRDGGSVARMAITDHVSDVQSRLAFYDTLLGLHAPADVAAAYKELVAAAKAEAGPQMTDAWRERPTRKDREVPLGVKLEQPRSVVALNKTITLMGKRRAP